MLLVIACDPDCFYKRVCKIQNVHVTLVMQYFQWHRPV